MIDSRLNYAIALTGGIACGKSSVSNILKKYGYEVICADEIAHKVLDSSIDEIVKNFGDKILDSSGNINRKALGSIVFSDTQKRKILESITHPKIHKQILDEAKKLESKKKFYFLDIPLFFESGGKNKYPVKFVLSIIANKETQIQRIKQRDNLDKDEALKRINAQLDSAFKAENSDFVIENNDNLENLENKIKDFLVCFK